MASLGGQSVPTPTDYNIDSGHRGASFVMADGSLKTDVVNASAKKVFAISWQAVSAANLANIATGYNTLATATGTWTDHNSASYTVTQDDGLPPLKYKERYSAAGARYDVSLSLREV